MVQLTVNIGTDIKEVAAKFGELKNTLFEVISESITVAAKQLVEDAMPLIPKRTGRLRDSGTIEELEQLAFRLVWSAVNPITGFNYAQAQYEKVFRHTDPPGIYAGQWVQKVLDKDEEKYIRIASDELEKRMQEILG